MTRDDIIATLRAHRAELEARKITSLALFGSFARGDAGPDSDVDLLFEYDLGDVPSLLNVCGAEIMLEGVLGRRVDLISRRGLRPHFLPRVGRDEVPVF